MRDIADGLASRGYFALVPDLFWRLEPNIQLTDKTDAEWKKALDLMGRFDVDKGVIRHPGQHRLSARLARLHRQGGRGGLLPGRAACLSHRGAHRYATPRSAIMASISTTASDEAEEHQAPLDAAHRRSRRICAAARAGQDRGRR